ncbi:MAG: ABC transporter ATP-binding protein [Gammaproteobacteria bacterium]
MSGLLRAEGLTRYYGKRCAVREISFSLDAGEVVGFLGPNGAGKSTTLNMLSGNLAPSSGNIRIHGTDLVAEPLEAKRVLGYLPDNPPLHGDSTVDEFLLFCAKIHRIPADRRQTCLETAKERCGLGEVGKRMIANLSKGFRQRIGVAQAILHSPPLIILDEPTVGLDPIQIREMRELIRDLGRNHGVILSSHILSEVLSTCTRTLVIHQGRLILDSAITDLERNMENSSLLVETRLAVNPEDLRRISGVDSVEVLSDYSCRIGFRKTDNPAEAISEWVVQSGRGLLQLRTERRTIEELFIQLTESTPTSDPVSPP